MKHRRPFLTIVVTALLAACATRVPDPEPRPQPPPEREPPRVEEPPASGVTIGAILPETGPGVLRQYGELIRQGIEIALEEHSVAGGRDVDVVYVDDAADAASAARVLAELRSREVVAVVGPLLSEVLAAAANARASPELVLISPTSSDPPPQLPNVYSLNAGDLRGAQALGTYAARNLSDIGLLFPNVPAFRDQAAAFEQAVARAGGRVAASVSYSAGTTTFAQPMRQLRDANVRAVFIPAEERDIRQLAPQLEYYGLSGVQVLGTEAWASDEVLRSVPQRVLEGALVAIPLYRASPDVRWESFVGLYEARYRRTLDNPYPALGYDAMRLLLEQIPAEGRVRASDMARALARVQGFGGATGVLSLEGGSVSRRPFLVQIRAGRPVPAEGSGT